MFVARTRISTSGPNQICAVFNVGDEVVGFENWPLPNREAALAACEVVDTEDAGASDLPGGRPPGLAGHFKDYWSRVQRQKRDPFNPCWRFGHRAACADAKEEPEVSASEQTLVCGLCGKLAKNERGLKIHQATAHREA